VPSFDFAALPDAPGVPSVAQIADAVAAGIPADARARARVLLSSVVLPWDLRGLAGFPSPRRLVEIAHATLVDALSGHKPEQRLAVLEAMAFRRLSQRALHDAVGLAVARWSLDHPSTVLPAPWNVAAVPFGGFDRDALSTDAARRVDALDALEQRADPPGRRAMRPFLPHARLTLAAASSGVFTAAAGPLLVFVRDLGVARRDMTPEVHDAHTDRLVRMSRLVPPREDDPRP
jgi:hypothetical protein